VRRIKRKSCGLRALDPKEYRGRVWVTRPRPGVDRFASAWLIRRFVDAEARFAFGSSPEKAPGAVPFDMYQAGGFKHEGDRCTFEVLCERFAIADEALCRIGQIVHDIDLKDDRFKDPHASTISALVDGLRASFADDATLLEQGMRMFEALYQSLAAKGVKRGNQKSAERRHDVKRTNYYLMGSALWLALLVTVAHSQGQVPVGQTAPSVPGGPTVTPSPVNPSGPVRLTATPPRVTTPQAAAGAPAVQARYVGSLACQRCHADTFERWSHTRMANVVTDPKVNPSVVIPDFSKPDPLVTFKLSDVALVYGTKWKQRYFIRKGDDYYPAPAQWDILNRVWRPYFVAPNTDWWGPHYPAQQGDNTGRPTGPLCDGCHSVNYNVQTKQALEWNVGCERCHGPGVSTSRAPRARTSSTPRG
jgi:hypothetical protein